MAQMQDRYRALLDHLPDGFARHEVVMNEDGSPVDYIFLEVNPAFEALTGLARDQVIGRRITEVLPTIAHSSFDWIAAYGQVAQSGQPLTFEQYSEPLHRWYEVTAYSDEPGTFITLFHDVTERRRTEEAREDQRMVTEQLLEQTLAGYWDWDIPRGTEYMSPTFKRMLGYEPPELADVPESWQALAFPEDLPDLFECVRQHFESHGSIPFSKEVRYHHKNGSTIWVICSGRVISWDEDGNPLRMIGSHVDITRLKRAEAELRESEERYRRLFEQSMDPIAIISSDGILMDANQALLETFGYDRSDLGHLNVRDHYVDLAERDEFLRHLERDGAVIDHEAKLRRRDGTVMDCTRSSVARRDESGRIIEIQTVCRDITEQRRAAHSLRDSEEKYRALFEQSADAAYIVTLDGRIIEVNRAWHNLFGYTHDDLHHMFVYDLYPDPKARDDTFVPAILRDGRLVDWEIQFKRKDGAVLDCTCSVSARRNEAGEIQYLQGFVRDVTAQKRAARELRRSEEKYRALFERSLDPIYIGAPDGSVIDANQAFLDLFGYTREDLKSINAVDFYVNPDEREDFIRRINSNGYIYDVAEYKRKDGSRFLCQRSQVAHRNDRGVVSAYQGFIRDITAEERAARELRESEEKYRTLFEQSKDAISVTTVQGRIFDANQAFLDLFGYSRDEVLGGEVVGMYAVPEDRERFVQQMLEHGELIDDEVQLRRKDGSVMDCLRNVTILKNDDGGTIGFQSVIRDITQEKRDREQLERSHQELQRLTTHLQLVREEERADVAWELHDEVGQALSAVTMDLEALRGKLPSATASAAHDDLDRATAQLHETIERIRRLYTDLRPGMLDDLGLAATVEWQASEFSRRSGIPCRVVRLDNVSLPDENSRLTLYRVFQEALGNVARHSGATQVEISVIESDGHVTVRVQDNGRGITEEEKTSPASLTLTELRERLQSHGGELDIRRGDEGGTVVEVSVPLDRTMKV